ncbi:YagK/YfjJ domain-containing protein [Desulfocurvibacter africanus]|uniref:YagK/YfjJ domain-containing protein n=1 Tax=Desulfocurvibacter africanus TaxID=873 RepID=UPI000428A02B|nr:inovirus-type Gp2 protein [Desulfocurvibacter africanus]
MIISTNNYYGFDIQVDEAKDQGCYDDILQRILDMLIFYISKHNKVLFVRFDVRFPSKYCNDSSNQTFSEFIAGFIKFHQRKGLDPVYVWVREQSREKHQHYHCILLLNGNKIRSYYEILQQAEAMWNRKLGVEQLGLINFCNRSRHGELQSNGIMLRRNDENFSDVFNKCFHWASYLAKTTTKDYAPLGIREFGSSRIPKDWPIHPKVQSILQ